MKTPLHTVAPGRKVRLKNIATSADGGWNRAAAEARTDELRQKLPELQERLYAEDKRSLLLIFQAMDTGAEPNASTIPCRTGSLMRPLIMESISATQPLL